MLTRKQPDVPHADLIDLLLDADEPTRKLLVLRARQTGALNESEGDELMAQVMRLERAAAPRAAKTPAKPKSEQQAA